ncbi:hypothetical protein YTPLAS18_21320 [Nitrospira sp.]|nr:hypothetical protein YTPLAS18_21320 [Nitrospira sp.]
MSLSRIMHREVISVTPTTSVRAVAKKMKDERIGSVLVKKGGKFVGIVTDTDVVRKGVAVGKDLTKLTADKIMSSPVATIEDIRNVHDAHDMMGDLGVRHLCITKAGEIVGIISVRDLLLYFQQVSEPKITQD